MQLVYALRILAFEATFRPLVVRLLALASFLASSLARPFSRKRAFELLCRAHQLLFRLEAPAPWRARLERRLRRACVEGSLAGCVETRPLRRKLEYPEIGGIVLKPPRLEGGRIAERGVLLLKYNEMMDDFRRAVHMPGLLQSYTLVLEPSWSAYANPCLLGFCLFREHPVLVMAHNAEDHRFLERLNSNLRPVAIGPADWVDPRVFRPLAGREKRFDAVMIARWTLLKGHHLLFRALREMGDPAYRVALLAHRNAADADRAHILAMLRGQGLSRQVEVFDPLDANAVNEVLNESKVNLLLSRQEGGNRSLFEGFFAGTPGLAFANHLSIPRQYFTPKTGRLIQPAELPEALLHFRDHWSAFEPRPWALEHIEPGLATARLNLALRQLAEERGESWTRDIVGKCNRPNPSYYPEESLGAGLPTIASLLEGFKA